MVPAGVFRARTAPVILMICFFARFFFDIYHAVFDLYHALFDIYHAVPDFVL